VGEKYLILNMSEFKRLEDRIQRWIRQAATQYETETAPESQATTIWGEFGNSHELPDELKRLLNDKDPHDDSASGDDEINEDDENGAPKFFSSWVQSIMKPTLDRLEALEKEVIALRKEVAKEKAEAAAKTKTESKPKKSTTSVGKKTATRARKKTTQPQRSSSPKRKSPAK